MLRWFKSLSAWRQIFIIFWDRSNTRTLLFGGFDEIVRSEFRRDRFHFILSIFGPMSELVFGFVFRTMFGMDQLVGASAGNEQRDDCRDGDCGQPYQERRAER